MTLSVCRPLFLMPPFPKINIVRSLGFLSVWCLFSVAPHRLSADTPTPIFSSDLENTGSQPWVWTYVGIGDQNTQRPAYDATNPHGGLRSVRAGAGNLNWNLPTLSTGAALELRFWARGVSNGPPLDVMIRQAQPTDRVFFRVTAPLTDAWQEYVYRTNMPGDIPAGASIYIGQWMRTADAFFWIDDISLSELPAVEGGSPATVNPVRNASFEAGTDGWTATFRKDEFGDQWQESGNTLPSPPGARLEVPLAAPGDMPPDGKRRLSFTLPSDAQAVVTSAYLQARYGHPTNLVFYLRSNSTQTFEAGVASGKNSGMSIQAQPKTASTDWKLYTIPLTLKPAGDGLYSVRFVFREPGTYEIDAVSLIEEEVPVANRVFSTPSFAIQSAAGTPVGNLFCKEKNEKPMFRLVVAEEQPNSTLTYQIKVYDYLERSFVTRDLSVTTDAAGYVEADFDLPATQYGSFRMAVRHAGQPSGEVLAEQIYSVLPCLPDPSDRPDSFFGSHIDLTPYNLEIARRAGYRWLRLYPPLSTQWLAVEPTEGTWTFDTAPVAQAKALGFHILGSFCTAADHAADIDPNSPVRNRWSKAWPPRDMADWKDYVTRTFTAFSPNISAWEIWNEPDGGYLQVKPGVKKDDVMLSLIQATREAFDSLGTSVPLIAPATASFNPGLAWQLLDRGAGDSLDAFSFHFYNLYAGGGSPDPDYVLPVLARYRTYNNRDNEPMPIWITESGLGGVQSWLSTYRIPSSGAPSAARGAATEVRAAMFFKAVGVRRWFKYYSGAHESGRYVTDDHCTTAIETTGIPGPALAAHAVMVSLTEDAPAINFESPVVDGQRVAVAHFGASPTRGPIDVYWSINPVPLTSVAGLGPDDLVLDLMGNPVSPATAMTGEFPIYVVRQP